MTGDPKPTLYQVLEAWMRAWEELLKEPSKLLLNRSFCNLIAPTLRETKPYFSKSRLIERSAKGWARGLLELLEAGFRDDDPEIYFYGLEYSQDVHVLEQLLKQGKFDVSTIYPLLEKIQDGPSPNTILNTLRNELTATPEPDFDRFITGSALMLRRGLTTHSVSVLKDRLSVSLARHGAFLAVRSVVPRFSSDTQLFDRISDNWKSFLLEVLSFDVDGVKSSPEKGLTHIFDLYAWDFKARDVLANIRKAVSDLLTREQSTMAVDQQRIRTLLEDELVRVSKYEYSLAYLRQLFEMPIGGARFESEHLERIGRELGTILLDNSFADKQFRHAPPYRPNPVDACCSDAFVKTIKEIASAKFSSYLKTCELPSLESEPFRALIKQLWDTETFQQIKWTQCAPAEIEEACEQWICSLDVQRQLAVTLKPHNQWLHEKFRQLLDDPKVSALEEWIDADVFWNQWREKFSKLAPWDRGIFHYIPWELFDERMIDDLFNHLTADLQPVADEWVVVFAVRKLDPPPVPKVITGITFYDPTRWDYGEKMLSSSNADQHITAAKVVVIARSSLESKRIAASHLREILNCMALSLSVSKMRGGFEPSIHPEIFARRRDGPGASSDRPLVRNERPIAQSFLNFERFGPMFDFLLQASRSASATMLQQKLLKALHWYAKARWDNDPAQSLLFYWIALEHLFEEGNDDRLLNLIAALHINWREVLSYGGYFLSRQQSEVMKQLNADPEAMNTLGLHDTLKDWDKDYRVLLNYQNVLTLLALIPSEKKSLKEYVQSYADYLQGFVENKTGIIEEMEALRSKYRFRLLVIKQIRNDIVHQALGYESNVGLYTDELEKIFHEAIVKLTNDSISDAPQCTSIKDLIAQYEELWIS